MTDFNLVDLLDGSNLPLKNRVNQDGHYMPRADGVSTETVSRRSAGPERFDALIPGEPLLPGEQYRFHFDMTRCVGCQCCVVACNEQNNNPADVNWRRVGEVESGVYPNAKRHHLSMACNHCLDPSCLEGCPTDAYVKLDTGIVEHQAEECIGCGYCTWNCPYGVPQFNSERRIVTKCDMCHSRLKAGQQPACVAACPEGAIQIEKVNIQEWRQNHTQADAPDVPDSGMTISTTRITVPEDLPETMQRANRHRIEPEQPHTSLIFMTVLTQLATGGFLTLWVSHLFSKQSSFLKPLQNFLPYGAWGMLIVTGIALFAAIFHLGRPLHAYKALRMWKRSWLSREVWFFVLFSHLGVIYGALQIARHLFPRSFLGTLSEQWLAILGGAVVFFGMAGVWASAKIYMVPARPAWNTVRTPLRFFLTGFVLGPLFALVVYALYVVAGKPPGMVDPFFKGPATIFLAVSSVSGFLQLAVLLSRLFYFRQGQPELDDSAFLLVYRLKNYFRARLLFLFFGSFIFPFALFHALDHGGLSGRAFVNLAVISFTLSLMGEFLGRYLFFVTVVPKNIPGSFFAKKGDGH